MKHAAIKPSSVAKATATRVVATIALATAATAVASPAMAHERGGHDGHGGGDGHSSGYDGRDGGRDRGRDGGHDRGRNGSAGPRSYEPAAYTEPNYDVPRYGSQQDCDHGDSETHDGWGGSDRDQVHQAVRHHVDETSTAPTGQEPGTEHVRTGTQVQQPVTTPVRQPVAQIVVAAALAPQAATPATSASSEPVAVQAPGQQWEGSPAADTTGAELTAYVPGADVQAVEQEAPVEATLDAPVRLATTGAEAAALTAAAGALVIGGAGSLLVARRSRVNA